MARPRGPLLLRRPTRIAGAPPFVALLVGAAVLLLAALSLLQPIDSLGDAGRGDGADVGLYRGILLGLRAGGDYYTVVADTLRAADYPLRPFPAFRLPTLAVLLAHLPDGVAALASRILVAAAFATWLIRLRPLFANRFAWAGAGVLLAGGLIAFVRPGVWPLHESWAAPLVALSLAVRSDRRWVEAVAIGAAAALLRETALLYLLLMLAFAIAEHRRDEAAGWGLALLVVAFALGLHAHAVDGVVRTGDAAASAWFGLEGLGRFAGAAAGGTALAVLPIALAAPLAALSLAGWFAQADVDLRVPATLAAFALAGSLLVPAGAPGWALLAAPLLLVGLIFLPDLLHDLARPLLDRRRVRVQRITR